MTISLDDRKIRPTNLMKKWSKLHEKDWLQLSKGKLIITTCPACNSRKFELKFSKLNFNFVECKHCHTLFVNPRPNEQTLANYYSSSKTVAFWDKIYKETKEVRKKWIFESRINLVKKILRNYGLNHCNTLVEVGPGHGWFCELAKKHAIAKRIIAIEPSPTSASACRKIQGIEVIESTIEKSTDNLVSDVITSFEIVCLLFSPKSFLESCYKGLKSGGILIISLTNYFGFDIQILQADSDIMVPNILNFFNPHSIKLLLEKVGFKKVQVITPGLLDVKIVLNKIKSGEIMGKNHPPFFKLLLENEMEKFIDDFQMILQKHNLSSHMVVSAQK